MRRRSVVVFFCRHIPVHTHLFAGVKDKQIDDVGRWARLCGCGVADLYFVYTFYGSALLCPDALCAWVCASMRRKEQIKGMCSCVRVLVCADGA